MKNEKHLAAFFVCLAGIGMSNNAAADVSNKLPEPVVKTPVRIDKAHPPIIHSEDYPKDSIRRGEQGRCAVRMEVDFDGMVRAKQLVISTGFGRLDAACLAAFADARFIPATLDGKPVASWINIPIPWLLRRGDNRYVGKSVSDDQLTVPIIQKDYELKVGPNFYSAASRTMHQEGDCTIHASVKEDGTTSDISVTKSTGFASLDEACVIAIQQAPFVLPHANGVAIGTADNNMSWRLLTQ